MILNKTGSFKAKEVLKQIGFKNVSKIPIEIFVSAFGVTYIEEPLDKCDGKIIYGNFKTLIKVNSKIPYPERKKFTALHELGHYFLHKNQEFIYHNDNSSTLNAFLNFEKTAKEGIQEYEANDFATEIILPEDLIKEFTYKQKFEPVLISNIAKEFGSTLTSVAYRLFNLKIYTFAIVYISKGIVHYYSIHKDINSRLREIKGLRPPEGSVADEHIFEDYKFLYSVTDKLQTVSKSVWFELGRDDEDHEIYEYCIVTKEYKSIRSIIWGF